MRPSIRLSTAVFFAAAGAVCVSVAAARQPAQPTAQNGAPPAQQQQQMGQNLGAMLTAAMKSVPGCLGTELAQTASGKNVIFGWFENKEALLAWHNHPMHQGAMRRFFPTFEADGPALEHIADGEGPLMAIAAITPAKPGDNDVTGGMGVSSIAIEVYKVMPAGIRFKGGFSPMHMKLDGLTDVE